MADGQKVTFSGEGDQEPGLEPGDIIIVLDEKEHPSFKRSGTGNNHLIKNPLFQTCRIFQPKIGVYFSPFKVCVIIRFVHICLYESSSTF